MRTWSAPSASTLRSAPSNQKSSSIWKMSWGVNWHPRSALHWTRLTYWNIDKMMVIQVFLLICFVYHTCVAGWDSPDCTTGLGVQVCSGVIINPKNCGDEVHISSTVVIVNLEGCPAGMTLVLHKGCPETILNAPSGLVVEPASCFIMVSIIILQITYIYILYWK